MTTLYEIVKQKGLHVPSVLGDVASLDKDVRGKTIVPPTEDGVTYSPPELKIVSLDLSNDGRLRVRVDSTLHKKTSAGMELVLKTAFFMSDDEDSIWKKWHLKVDISKAGPLDRAMISRMNSIVSATTCAGCGKPLVPMFGALRWCPSCEKDK